MWSQTRNSVGWLAGMALLICGAAPVRACGPWFDPSIINGGDAAVLAAPRADFVREIDGIKPSEPTPFKTKLPGEKEQLWDQTESADLADLEAALAELKTDAPRGKALLGAYAEVRRKLTAHSAETDRSRFTTRPAQPMQSIDVPAGLPGEFADYLRGAIQYHMQKGGDARMAWRELLERPAGERKYRSVWAAYMLGISFLLERQYDQAINRFEQVRELAGHGFADALGLAAASYGWQAKAELERGEEVRAIELYLVQRATGDGWAAWSLRDAAAQLATGDAAKLRAAAANPRVRAVVTALFVSRGGPFRPSPEPKQVLAWLAAVEAVAAKEMSGADRLAWAAYQAGQMDIARRWLDRAAADSPITQWIRAKLLLREGKVEAAAKLLAAVAQAFPPDEEWISHTDYTRGQFFPSEQARAQLGAIKLARGQYVESLDCLMRAHFWPDAAYVAERVLSVDELKQYVDRSWPTPTTRKSTEDEGAFIDEDGRAGPASDSLFSSRLRYLLARRLTRLGSWKEARPYYPPDLQPRLDAYIQAIRDGHDARKTERERAALLWSAAQIARDQGMELLGTELGPDCHIWLGEFAEGSDIYREPNTPEPRQALTAASKEEVARVARSLPDPNKRFHYRYVAAEHAWAAAQLLPDNSEQLAQILYEAGCWLKDRDPKYADRFYKALVNRCGNTALGKAANNARWFPPPARTP